MSKAKPGRWDGMCPAGLHGLDYWGQKCDLCPPVAPLPHPELWTRAEVEALLAAQREACAQWVMRADVTWDTLSECGDAVRATPLVEITTNKDKP